MHPRHTRFLLPVLIGILLLGGVLFFKMSERLGGGSEVPPTRYGITFSTLYAKQLGLDPADAYRALVEELGVRLVRLPVYWSEIERESGAYDLELLDQLIAYSEAMGVELTPVVGIKVPRWPECHLPDWARLLDTSGQHQSALLMIEAVVNRYKDSSSIERWQVENEPFFPFGQCTPITRAQFQERVDLVRSLDPDRPVQITVSGEIGSWTTEAGAADILGISMYRLTWNDLYGYFMYPLSPQYYSVRAKLVSNNVESVIVSELQAEPWFPEPVASRPLSVWYNAFDAQAFENNIRFVKDAHLPEAYLWGAEWWLLLREHGDARLWEVAQGVFGEEIAETM